MVTRQILVLKFQVRALVEQQKIKKGLENYFPNLFLFFRTYNTSGVNILSGHKKARSIKKRALTGALRED